MIGMILAEFSVTQTDWVDVFFLFAVISAFVGFILAVMRIPIDLWLFAFPTLVFLAAGLLCA